MSIRKVITDKIIEILEEALIDNVNDYQPAHIAKRALTEWAGDPIHYPMVIVHVFSRASIEDQIGNKAGVGEFRADVFVINFDDDEDDCADTRDIIEHRVRTALVNHINLDRVSDTTDGITETVWNAKPRGVAYHEGGFQGKFTAVARIDVRIDTEERSS